MILQFILLNGTSYILRCYQKSNLEFLLYIHTWAGHVARMEEGRSKKLGMILQFILIMGRVTFYDVTKKVIQNLY